MNPVAVDACHADLIASLVKCNKPKKVLELGFGSGFTTQKIIDALNYNEENARSDYGPPATFTLVDNWFDWNGTVPPDVQRFANQRVQIITSSEVNFVFNVNETWDFIFSDADHFNTDKWFDYVYDRLLNDGGILVYHDVCETAPSTGEGWFPNLAHIIRKARKLGLTHKLFNKQSRNDERCWRGLLVIFK